MQLQFTVLVRVVESHRTIKHELMVQMDIEEPHRFFSPNMLAHFSILQVVSTNILQFPINPS